MFQRLKQIKSAFTTYGVGLLQAKAYRVLKQHTAELLKPYGIGTVDWALFGLLYESPSGLKASELAEALGVEAPFITELTRKLVKTGLLSLMPGKEDKRVKLVFLTTKGKSFVPEVEKHLRTGMRPLLSGSRLGDLAAYYKVLSVIVKNGKK